MKGMSNAELQQFIILAIQSFHRNATCNHDMPNNMLPLSHNRRPHIPIPSEEKYHHPDTDFSIPQFPITDYSSSVTSALPPSHQ